MAFTPHPTKEAGGELRGLSRDDHAIGILRQILIELRIIKLHMAEQTDNEFSAKDVEEV